MATEKKIVTKSGAVILTSPEDLRQARLNQPEITLEEVRAQRVRHQEAVDESGQV